MSFYFFKNLAGFPTTTSKALTSLVTTAPAPIIAPLPILISGKIVVCSY